MKSSLPIAGLLILALLALSKTPASAWESSWQIEQRPQADSHAVGNRDIQMRQKYDHNPMNTFKGTTDTSNGYTIMRNLNGDTMRGYIDKDGSGLLRDQAGNFHQVNTRW